MIMDGNGRWAEAHGKRRVFGHQKGVATVRLIVEHVRRLGIPYLTLYAFSTENWKRKAYEVNTILRLLKMFTTSEVDQMIKNDIRVRFIGRRDRLPSPLLSVMEKMEKRTAGGASLLLTVAIDYGGRDELVRAFNTLRNKPGEVTEGDVSRALDTASIPDPDLVIRTGGKARTSNFLPWQTIYSEWVFTESMWPEFTPHELNTIIELYDGTGRTFGAVPAAAE